MPEAQAVCAAHPTALADDACPGCGRFLCEACLGPRGRCEPCRDRGLDDVARAERQQTWMLLLNPLAQVSALILARVLLSGLFPIHDEGLAIAGVVTVAEFLLLGEARHRITMYIGLGIEWLYAAGVVLSLMPAHPAVLLILAFPIHLTWAALRLRRSRGTWAYRKLAGKLRHG